MKLEEFVARVVEDLKSLDRFRRYSGLSEDELLEYKEMIALPAAEFREYYMKLMESHRYTDGWWDREAPACKKCGSDISGPEQLRMYEGEPYHPRCMRKVLDVDRYDDRGRKYWEKVLAIDDDA